jgi:hypothetical protein
MKSFARGIGDVLSPRLSAIGKNIFLFVSSGAALRQLRCELIGCLVGRRCRSRLAFIATQTNCTGGNDEYNQRDGRQGRKAFEIMRVHQ